MTSESLLAMDESGYVAGASDHVFPVSIEEKSVSEFKIGDVVRLKSGSPELTIVAVRAEGLLCTCWAGDKFHDAVFPADSLTAAKMAIVGD